MTLPSILLLYISLHSSSHSIHINIRCNNIITFVSYKRSALTDIHQAELEESETVATKWKRSSIHLSVTLIE